MSLKRPNDSIRDMSRTRKDEAQTASAPKTTARDDPVAWGCVVQPEGATADGRAACPILDACEGGPDLLPSGLGLSSPGTLLPPVPKKALRKKGRRRVGYRYPPGSTVTWETAMSIGIYICYYMLCLSRSGRLEPDAAAED